jgi:hypothetical protein
MISNVAHDLNSLAWDSARLGEAIELLARKARLLSHSVQLPAPDAAFTTSDATALAQWINHLAGQLGIEAEPVEFTYADAERFVRRVAPAILYLPQDPSTRAVIASEAKQSLFAHDGIASSLRSSQ